jgi:hypothetical protein
MRRMELDRYTNTNIRSWFVAPGLAFMDGQRLRGYIVTSQRFFLFFFPLGRNRAALDGIIVEYKHHQFGNHKAAWRDKDFSGGDTLATPRPLPMFYHHYYRYYQETHIRVRTQTGFHMTDACL